MGSAPASFPGTQADPYWDFIRRLYFYDPQPILKQLTIPTLALFGELDNNISAEKNRAAWEAALKAGGNPDYTLRILPTADHMQLEAKTGSNAEMPSLSIFVPEYRETIEGWLSKHIRGWMP
jgi:pimeloyl-ACP methyl ester carboxylesterase